MGEEFHAVIKLVTGEEIFALVCVDENDGDPIILLMNPVIMKVVKSHHWSICQSKTLDGNPTDDFYVIKYDKIVTMTEVNEEKVIEFYNRYLMMMILTGKKMVELRSQIRWDMSLP